MPRLKIEAASWSDRGTISQESILVPEYLQCARVFGFVTSGTVASCDENHHFVRRIHAHLMRIDSNIEICRLLHFSAERAILSDPVYRYGARSVVSDQHV